MVLYASYYTHLKREKDTSLKFSCFWYQYQKMFAVKTKAKTNLYGTHKLSVVNYRLLRNKTATNYFS